MLKKGLLILLLLFAACAKDNKPDSPVIARVGDQVFTVNDLKKVIPNDPDFQLSEIQLQNYVKKWIEMELWYAELQEYKFDENPEFEKDIRKAVRDLMVSKYITEKIDKGLEVTEEEIKEYYEQHSQEFVRPNDYYKVRLVLVKTYREAEEIRAKLVQGESFATLARENSLDESKENNGELGWVTLEQLPEVIVNRLPRMRQNRIENIKSIHGYYLVELLEKRNKGDVQTIEEVKDMISWRLMAWKRENKYKRYITYLGENAQVEAKWELIQETMNSTWAQ